MEDEELQAQFNDDTMTFADLGLCSEMVDSTQTIGWKYPSLIQRETIPLALEGHDIIGMAITGSGKTGAYALPILHQLLDSASKKESIILYALVLLPTRELAVQVTDVFKQLGESINIRVCAITGGVEGSIQLKQIKRGPHVIVATPGRLVQLMRENPGINFTRIRSLVFDEADEMLSASFLEEVEVILERIGSNRQTYLFSATMPDDIQKLAALSLSEPKTVSISHRNQVANTLTEWLIISMTEFKLETLVTLLRDIGNSSIIIFTGSCKMAQIVCKMLQILKFSAVLYHGKLPQNQRQIAVRDFRNGRYSILVATNVAARGLDVPHVDAVINYELPDHPEDYVHRVGRAGRAEKCGVAYTIITANDLIQYSELERFLKKKLKKYNINESIVRESYPQVEQARKQSVSSYNDFRKAKAQKLKSQYQKL